MGDVSNLISSAEKLVRVLAALARGPGRQALSDAGNIKPDLHGYGVLIGLHTSIAASNGGTDVTFDTNPDYDLAIKALRGYVEVGSAENTSNNGGASFNAAHCAFSLEDRDRTKKITNGKSPCAGGTASAYIDMALLGANGGPVAELPAPYVFAADKGISTITGSFATDASWPGTRRAGVLLMGTYRRRSFRSLANNGEIA